MRWSNQQIATDGVGDAPVLPGMRGLLRSVTTPEFAGVVFHEVEARSALNRVPGGSSMPFSWTINPYRGCSHACVYCLAGSTPVLMADGSTKPIGEIRVGEEIYGTERGGRYRHYVPTSVLAHWSTVKRAYRLSLADGTELVASGDHRFLTERGWKHVTGQMSGPGQRPYLTTGNSLLGTGRFASPPVESADYRRGYLLGVTGNADPDGDVEPVRWAPADHEALLRTKQYLAHQESADPESADPESAHPQGTRHECATDGWCRGLLAGAFDACGSCSRGILRISNTDPLVIGRITEALARLDFRYVVERSTRSRGRNTVRLRGGLVDRLRFFHTVDPAITRRRSIVGEAIKNPAKLDVVAVEDLGVEIPMYDITTSTGDFIANGVVSHNCFARNSHTYLELDAGQDFNSQIVVKVNIARVVEREVRAKRWAREHVAMGTNTDPYQRAEGRYRLMPGIIAALAASGTPLSILTKGTLLSRDLGVLAAAAKDVSVGVGVSIALLDRELHASVEPGTPTPAARLELVRRVRAAGLPCGVMVAPVLPLLTDSVEALDALLAEIAASGATSATVLALHLRPGTREWFFTWLAREHPALVERYQRLYQRGAYVDRRYSEELSRRVAPLLRSHGLARGAADRVRTGTTPTAPVPPALPSAEQLRLL